MSQRCSGRGSPEILGHVLVALHLHQAGSKKKDGFAWYVILVELTDRAT